MSSTIANAAHGQPVLSTRAYDIERAEITARIAQIVHDNTREGGAVTAE